MELLSKVTMVGNAELTFTWAFIENVLKEYNCKIDLLTERNTRFREKYSEMGVCVHEMRHLGFLDKIPIIKTLLYVYRVISEIKRESPNVVMVHYCWFLLLYFLGITRINFKFVLVYWGSDLLRANSIQIKMGRKAVKKANQIVVLTPEMEKRILLCYGNEIRYKLSVIDFGVSTFASIDKIDDFQEKKKKLFGVENANRVTITIGYNSSKNQQHLEVLKSLREIDESIKNHILLVFPMTYPSGNDQYIDEVIDAANKLSFKNIVIKDYMNEDEISSLCVSTDIFIHAQTTDALSTSMLEYLYAGAYVFNGKWLQYVFLDNLGVEYQKFDFTNIAGQIINFIKKDVRIRNTSNRDILRNNCGWDICKSKWKILISNL